MRDMLILRPRPKSIPDLCPPCAADKHDGCHKSIGCLRLVGDRPMDYVCKCDLRSRRAYLYALDTPTMSNQR